MPPPADRHEPVVTADGPPGRRAGRRLHFVGLMLIVAVVAAAALASWELRRDRIADQMDDARGLSVVLAAQAARSLQAVDLVLRETEALAGAGVFDPDQFRRTMAGENVHRMLVDRLRNVPQMDAISLIDDTGRIINFSRFWPAPQIDTSDRDFYEYWRAHEGSGVFIGAPVSNKVTGAWVITVTRRISGPRGEFVGIVLGVIESRYFEEFYQGIRTNDGQSVSLSRRDGTILARYPRLEGIIGSPMPHDSPWYATIAKGGGTYRTPGFVTHTPRIVSTRPIEEYPLAITVGLSEKIALAPWRRQTVIIVMGALGAIAGFIVLLRALGIQFGRIEHSEARFRDFATTSSDWFWETDANHRFTYISDGIRAFGADPEKCLGRTRRELATSDASRDDEKWRAHYAMLDRHEPFRDFIYERNIDGQSVWYGAVSGTPFFAATGRFLGYRGSARDITHQVNAERRLREAKDAAEAASHAKSQFLAHMSHELRTPLNAIIGFSEALELGIAGVLPPKSIEYAGLIRQSGAHLLNVINDILDLAKVDAGKFELHEESGLDPGRILAASVTLTRERAAVGRVGLSLRVADDLPPIVADPTRLKQVLLNLLSNAIKFTEPGGSVIAAVRRAADGGILFEVRDTGLGMTAAEIAVALQPFGQVEGAATRRHEGTGLGLPLAQLLTELHGGALAVDSEKGRGTTVTVALPASRVADPAGPPATAPLAAAM